MKAGINLMTARKRLYASIAGTTLVALCCFTPILVVALTAVGLATFTPYLDLVLFPALAVLVVVTWQSYRRYTHARRTESRQTGRPS